LYRAIRCSGQSDPAPVIAATCRPWGGRADAGSLMLQLKCPPRNPPGRSEIQSPKSAWTPGARLKSDKSRAGIVEFWAIKVSKKLCVDKYLGQRVACAGAAIQSVIFRGMMNMTGLFQRFVKSQRQLSLWLDRKFFSEWSVDGNYDFVQRCSQIDVAGRCLADIGSGKNPLFSPKEKTRLNINCVGVDIDAAELERAPPGAYDQMIVSDITKMTGPAIADIAICQSVLEHVQDNQAAFAGIWSICKPGALIYTFCPCRNAWFARINKLLPESFKKLLLFGIFPQTRYDQGFPAYYNRCTPAEFRQIAKETGFEILEQKVYYSSKYFMFFFPLYLFWRLFTYPFMRWLPDYHCETFSFVMRKIEK
jgi:SAM-dependent methyltransferase